MLEISPQASTATAPRRNRALSRVRTFITWVVVGALLALFFHYMLNHLVTGEYSEPSEVLAEASEKQEAEDKTDAFDQSSLVLDLVALPGLPVEAKHEINTPPAPSKSASISSAKPVVLDATSEEYAEQGRRMLAAGDADISIEFALPASPSARTNVLQLLRECVGVRLALLSANGDRVLNYEEAQYGNHADRSPYARALSGSLQNALLDEEYTLAYRWKKKHGQATQVVRVYPLNFDAKWLGAIHAHSGVIDASSDQAGLNLQVRGTLQLEGSALFLGSLRVNGLELSQKVLLARQC